jgi:hypothetical protein
MITLNMMNTEISLEISTDMYHNWDCILCDNCPNYEYNFYLYYGDGNSDAISDNTLLGLLDQAQEKGINPNDEVIINGCITTCSQAIALSPFISDDKAKWDRHMFIIWDTNVEPTPYYTTDYDFDGDIPF